MGQGSLVKGREFRAAFAAGALVFLLACFFWASSASADVDFCPPGEGAGQCAAPEGLNSLRGLAVDYETGQLYVADRGNNRVNVFAEGGDFLFAFGWGVDTGASALETCTLASTCQAGLAGSGLGQLNKPTKVAVDNDPASPNHHFVYVADQSNFRVELFDPTSLPVGFIRSIGSEGVGPGEFKTNLSIAVGPGGVLHVLDNVPLGGVKFKHRLQRFQPSGVAVVPPPPAECVLFEGGRARGLAVDSAGALWVVNEGEGRGVRKYGTDCLLLTVAAESEEFENIELALDEFDSLFVSQSETRDASLGSFQAITAFSSAGAILSRFAYGRIPSKPEGLAVRNSVGGGIYVAVGSTGVRRLDFLPPPSALPSPGPLPASPSFEVTELGATEATLLAEVNPEGKATEVHFEYLTEKEFEDQGEGFEGPATKKTSPVLLGADGFRLKATEATIGCSDPASEAELPESPCLRSETTYRWRVVATNADNPTGAGESSVEGPPFTTKESAEAGEIWATGVGTDTARLNAEVNPNSITATGFFEYVDDAAFQQDVEAGGDGFGGAIKAPTGAPLDFGAGSGFVTRSAVIYPLAPATVYHFRLVVDNALIEPKAGPAEELRTFATPQVESCANDASRTGPAAFLPDCRAYEMVSPPDKQGGDIRVLENTRAALAVLEQSSESGERLAYGSARSFGGAASSPFTSQYIARRVAGREWETHPINPPRGAPVFAAIGQFDTEFKAFSADLCDTWLTTFAEFPAPTPPGYTPGYSNLLRRTDHLCAGQTQYQALGPLTAPDGVLGTDFEMELLDVSANNQHAIFSANGKLAPQGAKGPRQLYEHAGIGGLRFVCILPEGGGPVSGSCTGGSATGAGDPGAQLGRISDDGQRIFWSAPGSAEGKIYVRIAGAQTVAVSKAGETESGTSKSWFWGAATNGSTAIFGTSPASNSADLYEFDVDSKETNLIAKGVLGVMGISEDADRVYFASSEVLSADETNSNGDKAQLDEPNLYLHETGGGIEFIATLASGDLTRAVSNVTYLNHTARVSPDGAHAAFVSVAPLTGYDNKNAQNGNATEQIYRYDAQGDELLCVSCNPTGARPAGSAKIPFWQTGAHAARVLSSDGARLYFESADVLAARDSNGRIDIYQWEEPGTGGCDEAAGAFSPAAGGCVELISSGKSPQDSRFVEASPTGGDVFFATVASLLPQDTGVFDIYDARVDGGLPIPPPPIPPCEGDACHAQILPPEEPTPASTDYVAPAGAPAESKPPKRRCRKGKRRVKRDGKSRCVAKSKPKRRRATR